MNKIYLDTRFTDGSLIHLHDVVEQINCGEDFFWAVLEFYAENYPGDVQPIAHHLTSNIHKEKIIRVPWKEVQVLAKGVGQFIDLVLIGSKDPKKLKPYEDENEMFRECDLVIIMFDTTWWEISSKEPAQMNLFIEKFKNEVQTNVNQGLYHGYNENKKKRTKL